MYKEVKGDLIEMALKGDFDIITHGCNCFNTMGAGIAPQMAKAFDADKFMLEKPLFKGDHSKLGNIDFNLVDGVWVVNSYTQFGFGRNHKDGTDIPLDYEALGLCLKKINHRFKGLKVGLPQIGCGLAGGDWDYVRLLIKTHLNECDVTVVIYNK